jgi:hypothetical protein
LTSDNDGRHCGRPSLVARLRPHPRSQALPETDGLRGSGSPAHDPAIQSETIGANGNATFTGTWHGEGGAAQAVTGGQIYRDVNGNIKITFRWGTDHALTGTLTKVSNPYVYTNEYYLDGTVTVNGVPGGPGHVTGWHASPRGRAVIVAWPPLATDAAGGASRPSRCCPTGATGGVHTVCVAMGSSRAMPTRNVGTRPGRRVRRILSRDERRLPPWRPPTHRREWPPDHSWPTERG